ncbi:MAG TPA: hypothetical protein DCY13_22320 [Verrucomicrobiales bacterium]|nr:hypothetical protein [Verrucomicrobiales bacterium]
MPKWLKLIIGLLLIPACLGAVRTFWRLLQHTGHADWFWVAFAAGTAIWLVIFVMLPKPMWIYVVGHELTHAVWTWVFGGRVRSFKAGSKGGHVVITRNNFVISLAPYFFPLYAAMVVVGFVTGHLIWNWSTYQVWFHLLLGAAYSFHITLTGHILRTRQSDITQHGYLFSAVVIFLGNILVLLVGLPLLTRSAGLASVMGWWLQDTGAVWQRLAALL